MEVWNRSDGNGVLTLRGFGIVARIFGYSCVV